MSNHTNHIISILIWLFAAFLFSTDVTAQTSGRRVLPREIYTPGVTIRVMIEVTGDPGIVTVVETPPAGWAVSNVGNEGKVSGGAITWDLPSFTGSLNLTYAATPPYDAAGDAIFIGRVGDVEITGMNIMRNPPLPFQIGIPINLGAPINSTNVDVYPFISQDNLTFLFTRSDGASPSKADIWMANRTDPEVSWSEPVNLSSINYSGLDTYATLSWDGLQLYFTSDRSGRLGGYDIWVSTRSDKSAPWGPPVNPGANLNSTADEWAICLSQDGLALYFSSTRSGGFADYDIWVTTRPTVDSPWEPAVNLGAVVNSSRLDSGVCLSADSLFLFFISDRPGGFGGFDLYLTTRTTVNDPWSPPINLGAGINTKYDESCPSLSPDGSILYFSDYINAPRPGGMGAADIWQVSLQKIQSSVKNWMRLR